MPLDTKHVTDLAKDLAAQFVREFEDAAQAGIAEVKSRMAKGAALVVPTNGAGKRPGNTKGMHIKRDMSCRVEGCKNRSKGPRFGFVCEEHGKKLSKAEQKKVREKWNAAHK